MRVLLIDTDRCGLDFAWRCAEAGHDVHWYNRDKEGNTFKDGDGFPGITKIDDWKASMKWAKDGLIWLSSNAMFLKEMDEWKKHGYPIFAPSQATADLEIKRAQGMKLLEKIGLLVPTYHTFANLKEAESFARKADQPFVFKTMGDNEDKSLSYVAKTPADLVGRIQRWIKLGLNPKGQVMLQEKIDGIEMGISCWFGPDGPLPNKWNINFEHKKLMPGNYGPNTGEMGTVIQYCRHEKMADELFIPELVDHLKKIGHIGDIDLNCIIEKGSGKIYPLEFTTRPGWPYDWIASDLHKGDPVQWMKDLLDGEDTLKVSYDVAIGEVVAIPPFPRDDCDEAECMDLPIELPKRWNHIHPVCMQIEKGPAMESDKVVEKDIYTTSGNYVLVATGIGDTVKQAKDQVDALVKKVNVSNMIIRNDIGDGLEKCLPDLHKLGFATSMEFDS
jgi:phosphoribosylamine---glycine ligase